MAKRQALGSSEARKQRRPSAAVRIVAIPDGQTQGKARRVRFGAVEIKAASLKPAQIEQNIAQGREALARAAGSLKKAGVKLRRAKGVAFYAMDPEHPDRIVRTIDGVRERGVFENGRFQVLG